MLHELHDDVRVCKDITRYLRVYNIHGVCQCGGGLGIEARYSLIGHSFTRGLREDDTSLSSGHPVAAIIALARVARRQCSAAQLLGDE